MTCNKIIKAGIAMVVSILASSCIEPTEIATENFENILVIDALITDELKRQEIVLSRTFRFEDSIASPEGEALVSIKDDVGNEYVFEESEGGRYVSQQEFQAILGQEYQMFIETTDGQSYASDKVMFQQKSSLDSLYAVRMFNDDGVEGIGILADSFDPTRNSAYYRYEYEEAYRYVAKEWINFDIKATTLNNGVISITYEERSVDKRTCYNQVPSNNIVINNTLSLAEDRVKEFEVKFIKADDISIADRYSILVRQYVQSREANAFYETLSNFSESENFLSQIQPGFINGNITSTTDPDLKVLGYFEVSAVSEKRIFFNHDDILSDLPEFRVRCMETLVPPWNSLFEPIEDYLKRVQSFVNTGVFVLSEVPLIPVESGGPVFLKPRACGDCTVFGKSEVPDFWID